MFLKKIKNIVIPFLICFVVALGLYPNTALNHKDYSTDGLKLDYNISSAIALNAIDENLKSSDYTPHLGKSFQGFKEALAFKESRGNYFTVNTLGYLGKYQFGKETLKILGVFTPNQFLYNPELQEKAFIANLKRNKWILRKDIAKFNGKVVAGVNVTESGILAAAHLGGPGNVKRFLRSYGATNFSDAYGSRVSYYMKKFAGYDTSFIEPEKRAKVEL